MTRDLIAAAAALAATLERENAILIALDLAGAGALLEAKRCATEAFAAAHARLVASGATLADADRQALEHQAARLRHLAQANRRLLERALVVQERVMSVIARAAPKATAQAPRYGAAGTLVGGRRALPVALLASA